MLQFFKDFERLKNVKLPKYFNYSKISSYFSFLNKSKGNLLAIDIGSSSIKMVEISKKAGVLTLESCYILDLPADCIQGHQIKSYSTLTETLSKFVKQHGYANHDTALILSGPQVVTQVLRVPSELADNQLVTHIELEAEKHLPFNVEELSIDFDVLKTGEANEHLIEVLLAAAKRDFVEEYINIIKAVDLNLRVIDVYGCVMGRLSYHVVPRQLQQQIDDKVIAMIDLGQDVLTLSIFKNERQLYIKEQNFGGKDLTNLIMKEHSISKQQAEELKLKQEDPVISILLDGFKEKLTMQINQMLQFFYSSMFADKIDYVFILGGLALLKNLDQVLEHNINIPVTVLDPFIGIDTTKFNEQSLIKSELDTRLSAACGLALRSYVE